jgi:hypothetical protein
MSVDPEPAYLLHATILLLSHCNFFWTIGIGSQKRPQRQILGILVKYIVSPVTFTFLTLMPGEGTFPKE